MHKPVLLKEVIEALELKPGKIIIDCTIGLGGHAEAILDKITPGGKLIGLDKDAEALEIARDRLSRFGEAVIFARDNFDNLKVIFERIGIAKADGFLFDLGVSSLQLDKPERGFSFRFSAPLDMRMDKDGEITARRLVNESGEAELDWILSNYGEERFHRRIARAIVTARKKESIETTEQLVDIILRTVPYKGKHGRVHPATRSFQALRIAVNGELSALDKALNEAVGLLSLSGIICVISYHSLEDRIVKNKFKGFKAAGELELLYKKPLIAGDPEIEDNPRSRSAKLRAARRIKV